MDAICYWNKPRQHIHSSYSQKPLNHSDKTFCCYKHSLYVRRTQRALVAFWMKKKQWREKNDNRQIKTHTHSRTFSIIKSEKLPSESTIHMKYALLIRSSCTQIAQQCQRWNKCAEHGMLVRIRLSLKRLTFFEVNFFLFVLNFISLSFTLATKGLNLIRLFSLNVFSIRKIVKHRCCIYRYWCARDFLHFPFLPIFVCFFPLNSSLHRLLRKFVARINLSNE